MTVLAYIRVSSSQQENNSSLEHQKSSIENYCKNHNLVLKPEFIFTEVDSGANPERIQFNKMRDVLKTLPSVRHLIVYSIDRLTRSVYVGEIIAKEIRDKKGSVVSVSQGFDDATATGKMTRQMLTVMAEQERDMIVQRTSNGRKSTIRKGFFGGGKAPMGYKSMGSPSQRGFGQLNVIDIEKEAVMLMFELHKKGKSYRGIAEQLTKKGLMCRKGTPYNPGTIKKIIDNKHFYEGKSSLYEEDSVAPQHPVILED